MHHQIYWTPQKIARRLSLIAPLVYRQRRPLPPFRYITLSGPLEEPPVAPDMDDSPWETIAPNTYWGAWMTDFTLRAWFQVPAEWGADQPVALYLPIGNAGDFSHPEALVYIDGEPYAAADRHHLEILLSERWRDGSSHLLALHGWTGLGGFDAPEPGTKLFMRECAVVQIDPPTREFIAVAQMALGVAEQLPDHDPVKGRLYNALNAAFKVLDTRDPLGTPAFYDSISPALSTLKAEIDAAGAPLDVDIIGVGHAHIDVAWLWTLGQTRRKAGRTFSTVLRLMEEFPDYTFSQSQPQLYQYVEESYPEIFAQIKERVKEGRWELIGGTWVEPDINAIGAEALARQFLLGRTYFRDHFGEVDTPVLWLPDTFGYSWALPQLIKQAGMKYFITHKMSWNQYNRMPHQILWWQGLDGTRVLTHFLTTPSGWEFLPYGTTYNGTVSAAEILGTWEHFAQKELHNELLTAYGYGDGGGGPTREMIQNMGNLAHHPGAPRVRPGTVREFMERIEQELSDQLPVWNGEFYLEYHRGTYTSQGRTKRHNRKNEFLLHDAEFLAAWAALLTGYQYPHDDLTAAWKLLCLNQFHDILPGSSIGPVYADSRRDHQRIRELGETVREEALTALVQLLPPNATIVAVNPTSFAGRRTGILPAELAPNRRLVDLRSGISLITQAIDGGTLVEVDAMAPYSLVPIGEEEDAPPSVDAALTVAEEGDRTILENALLRVEFDTSGDISRIFDKEAGREVLAPSMTANTLLAFEDRPMNFDAWDIDIYYEDRPETITQVESITVVETGPLRIGLRIHRRYRSSEIIQTVYLYRDSKRIDFDTWIDWREQHVLLKTAFPVNILSPMATFDIQWGNVQRPTHRNTSWDWARFETCAHKWADLSESNYGVALLNDCKYGYDIHDHVMRLTLIKSATSPDPTADQGEHVMTYSLLPHRGDWREGVASAGYDLNDPLILRCVPARSTPGAPLPSLVAVDAPHVVIETIKQAEDALGIIVRLYENERARDTVAVRAGFPLQAAYRCNLLEVNEAELAVQENEVRFEIAPYQIVTLRLVPRRR
jgi:alpha-mannosidase